MTTSRIGVRCSQVPITLWFHVETRLLIDRERTPTALYKENGRVKTELLTLDTDDVEANFTVEGQAASDALLGLLPEETHVTISAEYINIAAHRHQLNWEQELPKIIAVIKQALKSPHARVEHEPPKDSSITEWHLPLLRELFGVTT